MPYKIAKRDDKYCVVNSANGNTVHCHETRAKAVAQLRALYANVKDAKKNFEPSREVLRSMLRVRTDLANPEVARLASQQLAEMVGDPVEEGLACWMGLWLDPDTANSLAVAGDEMSPPEDLHITLAMAKGLDLLQAAQFIMAAQMAARMRPPLEGKVGGQGRFWDPSGDGMDVIFASPDVPDLEELRGYIEMCCEDMYGLELLGNHGWTPHITLGYVEAGAAFDTQIVSVPLSFGALTVMVGDWSIELPLSGLAEEARIRDYTEQLRAASETFTIDLATLCARQAPTEAPEVRLFVDQGAAFGAAETPETINVLPKPGTYKHPIYGDIVITRERNANFVANHRSKVYQQKLPIDAEHQTKLSGALGYINSLTQNSDGSVDAQVEWTSRGKTLIKEDRFRYVSPEWYDEWQDPATGKTHQDILIGAALTTRPFFKEDALRPLGVLVASEDGIQANEEIAVGADEVTHTFRFIPATEEGTMTQPNANQGDPKPKEEAPAAAQQAAETISPAQFAEMQAQLHAANETIGTLRSAVDAERTAREATELSARTQRFTDMALGHGGEDDGLRWAGEPQLHVRTLEVLRSASEEGEQSQGFTDYVTLQRSIAAQMKGSVMFREVGRGGDGTSAANAGEQLTQMATKLSEDRKIALTEAYKLVTAEHPELAERNRREVIDQKG